MAGRASRCLSPGLCSLGEQKRPSQAPSETGLSWAVAERRAALLREDGLCSVELGATQPCKSPAFLLRVERASPNESPAFLELVRGDGAATGGSFRELLDLHREL